jgi:hypothetical protein
MRKNRVKLYLFLVEEKIITNKLYPDWVDAWFKDESTTTKLYNQMVKLELYTDSIDKFFKLYACDIYPNNQYCQGVSQNTTTNNATTTNTVDDSHVNATFSCVNNSQVLKGITKSLNGSDSIIYKLSTGGQLQFNTDKTFIYISRNDPNRKINGAWDCNGENEFIVNTENGARLDSKVGYWKNDVVQKSTITPSNDSTTNVTGNIKMGDKGEQVTEIQNLLIKNGYKNVSKDGTADGDFGSRTLGAVKDFQSANKDNKGQPLKVDGIVGIATMEALNRKKLQENIIKKVLKRNLEMKNK